MSEDSIMSTDGNYNHLVPKHREKVKLMEISGFAWKPAEGPGGSFVLETNHRRDVICFETVSDLSLSALENYVRLVCHRR
jgi:hypothetical protein